jgi:hypothetical protein
MHSSALVHSQENGRGVQSTRGGRAVKRFTLEQIQEASEDMSGFCLNCGEEAWGVEPDARKYRCEYCGDEQVFGTGEILIMGLVR